jgi:hypothetical protein
VTEFFAGVAVGALLAIIVLAIAQNAGKLPSFAAEDKAADDSQKAVDAIAQRRDEAHAIIDQLTPDEIDSVLNGAATLDDVVRARAVANSGKPPSSASGKPPA